MRSRRGLAWGGSPGAKGAGKRASPAGVDSLKTGAAMALGEGEARDVAPRVRRTTVRALSPPSSVRLRRRVGKVVR